MCGAPKEQVVTQKTELDPALRRHLYGGTIANPRGGFGSDNGSSSNNNGGDNGGAMTVDEMFPSVNTPVGDPLDATGIGSPDYGSRPAPSTGTPLGSTGPGSGGLYAMGGPVMPQQGLASLNQGQMPMMNGQMPNLSDPMTAATLAMAVRSPQMRYGSIMAQPNPMMSNPMQGYAMGGYIEGPGTGTSDSIPAAIYQDGGRVQEARLSDGEFVMTKSAVDGAGGAAQMYRMMHDLEKRGKA